MCERAALTNRPSLDLSPIALKGTSASTASHRAFRDDREPPLLSGETGEQVPVICPTGQEEYFLK
jgi:hypothetical protein